jgi:hypothetical protein
VLPGDHRKPLWRARRIPHRELGRCEATYPFHHALRAANGEEPDEAAFDNIDCDLRPFRLLACFCSANRQLDCVQHRRWPHVHTRSWSSLWLVSRSRPSLRMVAGPTSRMVTFLRIGGCTSGKRRSDVPSNEHQEARRREGTAIALPGVARGIKHRARGRSLWAALSFHFSHLHEGGTFAKFSEAGAALVA